LGNVVIDIGRDVPKKKKKNKKKNNTARKETDATRPRRSCAEVDFPAEC
jgi:hypothetical protein